MSLFNLDHVPRRWLQFLHILYITVDVAIIGSTFVAHWQHAEPRIIHHWAFTGTPAIVAAIHLMYGLVIYPYVQKRNAWVATIISQSLFDLIFAALIQDSGYNNPLYRIAWAITVGLSAMVGFYMVLAEVCVDAFLNFLAIIGIAKASSYTETGEWFITVGVALTGVIGWLIFRHFYESASKGRFDELNQHLARAQLQSNLIFQSIADGVIVFDVSGKINSMNPAAATLTGWPVKDGVGLDVHLVMKLAQENGKPLDNNQDLFMKALQLKQSMSETVMLVAQDDSKVTISLAISPIVAPGENEVAGAVAVFRNVTAERKQEQQRAEFISTASHEMRTPVAAIEGYLSLALNPKVSRIDTKAREYLEKAHASTQNLGKLFQDLLTSARAEDGRLSSHPVVVEMGDYLQTLVDGLRFAAEKKKLTTEFTVGSENFIDASHNGTGGEKVMKPLYYVFADPDRLREVITNLFDNAVKYTPEGKIIIGLTGDKGVVQLYVRDTGAGIPTEDIPHLFQKFYRVDNSATRTIGGTGLGLFISRKIVELYRGRIWVESKLGQGSTFYINLPRLTPEKATELQAKTAVEITPATSSTLPTS